MAEDPAADFAVKPQQLIGGINGLVLQLHKMHVELEEAKHQQQAHEEKIKIFERSNENLKNEVNDLTKVKERLTEQSEFLQKSLKQKKTENNDLLERLKQAEIQLGESGSVLDTVKNLESKNEVLSVQMSTIMVNTEEEIAKAKIEREHYIQLLDETNDLNKRNLAIQKDLEETEKISLKYHEQAKAFVEKAEKTCAEFIQNLDEVLNAKKTYLKFHEEKKNLEKKVKTSLEANELLQRENKDLKIKMKDLETKNVNLSRTLKEQRKSSDLLKEKFVKIKQEKEELYKEVHSLWKQDDNGASSDGAVSSQNVQKSKQYKTLEEQMKVLAETCGKTTEQLGLLKESVNENKDLLKANIESATKNDESLYTELECVQGGSENPRNFQAIREYVAIIVEMQEFFKHSDVRDEELASLENLAGIPEQRLSEKVTGHCTAEGDDSGIGSCIRGLVAMKDSQINALMTERDELDIEIAEKKKIEYRQLYLLNEMRKEKDELLKKITVCQEKYRKVKEEKEDARRDLLVRNATDTMTHTYMDNLKQENQQYKQELKTQQESFQQKYIALKSELNKKLETKDKVIQDMKEKLVVYQHERDTMKTELNSRQLKDNTIKEQIISIFGH